MTIEATDIESFSAYGRRGLPHRRSAISATPSDEEPVMLYKNIDVDGLNIFYRETGK